MKSIFLCSICALIVFTGCPPRQTGSSNDGNNTVATNHEKPSVDTDTDTDTEETVSTHDGEPSGKTYPVSGTVMRTAEYCGGAAPSQEMLDKLRTPHPFAGMKVHVRKGGTNKIGTAVFATSTTNESGEFSFDLPPGTWCVVMDEKGPDAPRDLSGQYVQVDDACYKEWLTKCDQAIEVIDVPIPAVKLQFRSRCHLSTISNCVQWVGPLPPSAPPRDR